MFWDASFEILSHIGKKKKPKKNKPQGNVIEAVNQRAHTSNQL